MADSYHWVFLEEKGKFHGLTVTKMDNRYSRVNTFVKEICQNSKDALLGNGPVVVEFDRFFIKAEDFPDVQSYRDVVEKCIKTEEEETGVDATALARLKSYRRTLKDKICILRVSDYNTTGLLGSKTGSRKSPWGALTWSAGISNKSNKDQGGSFGIGKASYFEVSRVRSVFFSTKDAEGIEASMGVSSLMSYLDGGIQRSGDGRCGDSKCNPIPSQLSLKGSNYKRSEKTGTDIYIMGYEGDNENWKDSIVMAVLHDFFYSILDGGLIIKVGEIVIDSKTIHLMLQKYIKEEYGMQGRNYNLKQLSACIETMSEPAKCYPDEDNPRYKLYLRPSEDENGIISVRSGMTISDKYQTSKRMKIVGVLSIIDKKTSSLLKYAENITHNKWSISELPLDFEDRNVIGEIIKEVDRFVREETDKLFKRSKENSVDAEGIERYLFKEESSTDDVGKAVKDSQFAPIQEVQVSQGSNRIRQNKKEGAKERLPAKMPEDDEVDDTGALNQQKRHLIGDSHKRVIPDENPLEGRALFERVFKTKQLVKNPRVCTDNEKRYSIWFDTDQTGDVYLEARLIVENGETGEPLEIISAFTGDGEVKCEGSIIGPVKVKSGSRNKVSLSVSYPILCSIRLEVVDYGQ